MKPITMGEFAKLSHPAKCDYLRKTQPDLKGFVKVLEIIEAAQVLHADIFSIYPHADAIQLDSMYDGQLGASHPVLDWTKHDMKCIGCIGSLLAWHFDKISHEYETRDGTKAKAYCFLKGMDALAAHLRVSETIMKGTLTGIIVKLAWQADRPREHYIRNIQDNGPFSMYHWPVSYLQVFRELQKTFPDK